MTNSGLVEGHSESFGEVGRSKVLKYKNFYFGNEELAGKLGKVKAR